MNCVFRNSFAKIVIVYQYPSPPPHNFSSHLVSGIKKDTREQDGRRLSFDKKIEVPETETSILYTLKGISRKAIRGGNRESLPLHQRL